MTDVTAFRQAIGHFATGVTVVTAPGPAGATSNAVCSLSLDPLLVIACLDHGSRTLAAIQEHERAGVSVLSAEQRDVAVAFANKDTHEEKFGRVGWTEHAGVPVLDGAVAWLGGAVREAFPGGDHEILVIEVEEFGDEGGAPLVFYKGTYGQLSA